jgi:hypothetical protein
MKSPGSSSGGSSNHVSGHAAASGVTAQTRAGEAARAEVLRLQESLRLAVSALQAIGDRARYLSRYSARVRVLELEVIPTGSYLSDRADLLLGELKPGSVLVAAADAIVMTGWAREPVHELQWCRAGSSRVGPRDHVARRTRRRKENGRSRTIRERRSARSAALMWAARRTAVGARPGSDRDRPVILFPGGKVLQAGATAAKAGAEPPTTRTRRGRRNGWPCRSGRYGSSRVNGPA